MTIIIIVVVLKGQSSKHLWDVVHDAEWSTTPEPRPEVPAPARAFRFSRDQTTAIVEAYRSGETATELARRYDVRVESITHLLIRKGVKIRKRRLVTEADVARLVALRASGLSTAEIADRSGWSENAVYKHLRRHDAKES